MSALPKEPPYNKSEHTPPANPVRQKIESSERIDDLRERLYERSAPPPTRGRKPLSPLQSQRPVTQSWKETPRPQVAPPPPPPQSSSFAMTKTQRHSSRTKIVLAGIAFFVAAMALSSAFLYFGNNTISGSNIAIAVSGPSASRGGGELPLQISVANQNTVPIESATLIIDYPSGSQSVSESGKELFSERQSLTRIGAGQVVNVPVRAVVFGEENEEKIVNVAVEYRVEGSNATFFKEAEPFRFKISSSPVVLNVKSVERISSGQEAEITVAVGSNSPTPITNVLVKATYPFGFDFSEATPNTVSGQNTWLIDSLDPEEEFEIVVKGVVVGKENEDKTFSFSAGVPNERDPYTLASVFVNTDVAMVVEQPFLGVDVRVNGSSAETVAIPSLKQASVQITYENTLSDSIYDAGITVQLSGNAVDEFAVETQDGGFYNSSANTITWDRTSLRDLEEIQPGRGRTVNFVLTPKEGVSRTPEVRMDVSVSGQRVSESNVPQELAGTASRTIRVESITALTSSAYYTQGPFTNSGPTPPVVGERTQYAFNLIVQNGSNDVTNAEVTAELPQYVEWLDHVTSDDTVAYNPSTRIMTWEIGNMDAGEVATTWVQVAFLPSTTQVDRRPIILETQRFRATDRFTGSVVRSEASSLTTELFNDPDEDVRNGRVQEDD